MTIPSCYLHFTKPDNSTTFIDSTGKTNWNGFASGTKILNASLYFNGGIVGTFISDDSFDIGAGNFTIHFYAKFLDYVTGSVPFVFGGTGIIFCVQEAGIIFCRIGTGSAYDSPPATISDIDWHHFAYVRSSNNFYQFMDGFSVGTPTDVNTLSMPASMTMGILGYYSNSPNGYMDDFCFIKGEALWTDTFIPPPRTISTSSLYPYSIVIT